jgi:hypothetical protein
MGCVITTNTQEAIDIVAEFCTMRGGIASAECPPGGTGACTTIAGDGTITNVHYVTNAQTLMDLETSCTSNGGTWSVP